MYTTKLAVVAAALVNLAVAQTTTVNVLLGSATAGVGASIVTADACSTVVALSCTDTDVCSLPATVTVTQGPSFYSASFGTSLGGASAIVTEHCDLSGPAGSATQAVCTEYLSASGNGVQTTTKVTTTLTGAAINYQALTVSGNGVAALSSATGSCTSSKNAAPTNAVREVYKVMVPIGAAMLALA